MHLQSCEILEAIEVIDALQQHADTNWILFQVNVLSLSHAANFSLERNE